ncbi:MAG: LacI family DNA-binding transcriptional regulator [Acidobacteriota bacterium]
MFKKKVTLSDIAHRLGVSKMTVSLALRDHPRIPEKTKNRVRKVMREMGYAPDPVARALTTGRSNLIGVIVPNSSDIYYAEVIRAIEDAARSANYQVILSSGSYSMEGYTQRVRDMMSLRIRGIITAPPFTSEKPKLAPVWQDLKANRFPFVLINRQLDPPVFHQVTADYTAGVQMVIEALAEMGHTRVAYVSGHPAMLPIRQRLSAFKHFALTQGFVKDQKLFENSELNYRGGYHACERLWTATKKKPTAIVAFSDTVAIGVLKFLDEHKVRVPDEVSVIGFDGTDIGQFTHASLSTVSTPMYEIGKEAFGLLNASIEGKHSSPQSLILPVKLILRDSTGPAPALSSLSRGTLRFAK